MKYGPLSEAPPISDDVSVAIGRSVDATIAEADHRIANNLTLISGLLRLHSRQLARGQGAIERKDVKLLLDDVAGRIQTVARLHALLARGARHHSLELSTYLPDVCRSATSSLASSDGVRLSCRIAEGCIVPPDTALSLGLMICELVTNSVKYAHPSGLPVVITLDCMRGGNGELLLAYADDGVGLPDGFDPKVDGGIGFLLVRSRAEHLNAQYRFEHDCLGLRFYLTIPAAGQVFATHRDGVDRAP